MMLISYTHTCFLLVFSHSAGRSSPGWVLCSTTSIVWENLEAVPPLIDAALTNAGIVFCGQSEAESFSRFLLNQLNSTKLPKRLMPMIEQYGRLPSLRAELDTLLASQGISEEYRNNLLTAKAGLEKPKNNKKNKSTGR